MCALTSLSFLSIPCTYTDTHAQNILIKGEDGQGPEVKLVDAEKSMIGPCGFDMGLFLANFAFYMSQARGLSLLIVGGGALCVACGLGTSTRIQPSD